MASGLRDVPACMSGVRATRSRPLMSAPPSSNTRIMLTLPFFAAMASRDWPWRSTASALSPASMRAFTPATSPLATSDTMSRFRATGGS